MSSVDRQLSPQHLSRELAPDRFQLSKYYTHTHGYYRRAAVAESQVGEGGARRIWRVVWSVQYFTKKIISCNVR